MAQTQPATMTDESPGTAAADRILEQLDVVEKSFAALRALIEMDHEERRADEEGD